MPTYSARQIGATTGGRSSMLGPLSGYPGISQQMLDPLRTRYLQRREARELVAGEEAVSATLARQKQDLFEQSNALDAEATRLAKLEREAIMALEEANAQYEAAMQQQPQQVVYQRPEQYMTREQYIRNVLVPKYGHMEPSAYQYYLPSVYTRQTQQRGVY